MDFKIREVSTSEVKEFLNNEEYVIVDVRPTHAYNGWQLRNEQRSGHIKGARTLPVKWAEYLDWIEIVRHKNILPSQKIVLYGYDEEDIIKVAKRFNDAGYDQLFSYKDFLNIWCKDESLPMNYLSRYAELVYPQWVNQLLHGEKPPVYNNNDNFVICHCHYRNYDDYLEGHIPGAIALDTLELESPETWNRRSPEELSKAFQKHGIDSDTTVVVYGRYSFPDNNDPFPGSSAGQLGAIRCAMIMLYAGVKDVRVLNGGIAAWEAEKLPLSKTVTHPVPKQNFGANIPVKPEIIVDIEEAKNMIAAPDADIICTRSYPEYIGEVSGYNYIEKKGRIPGAVYIDNGSDAYHMENYQNLDYTTREFHEIEQMLREAGLLPDKHLAFYCGTGWRGSEAFYNVYLMGWPRVSVFDGGWFEWSNDPQNPVETGVPA